MAQQTFIGTARPPKPECPPAAGADACPEPAEGHRVPGSGRTEEVALAMAGEGERRGLFRVLAFGRPAAVCVFAVLLGLAVLLVDLFLTPDQDVAILYAVVIVVVSFTRNARWVVASGLTCLALLLLSPLIWPPGLQWLRRMPLFLVDGSALLLVTGVLLHRLRIEAARDRAVAEREAAWQRIKILEGLLRACAWCKRVREEDGQWIPLETYVANHSEAHFTHGICPECLARESDTVHRQRTSP